MKSLVRSILGDKTMGWIDYFRWPERGVAWGGPLNGQAGRQALFEAIITTVRPVLILETGTYLGTSTEFMAKTGLPVVTVEAQPRNYGFARARLHRFPNITLFHADSRAGIRRVFDERRELLNGWPVFAYLDAHWNDDLPLAEEIEILFENCLLAVAMIDDFQVPGDAGYGYDNYGPAKSLDREYIEPTMRAYRLAALCPVLPSHEETGVRRGCIVLANEIEWAERLLATALLRRA